MLRLVLLGGLRLEGSEGPLTGRATQKRRLALLALLAVPPGGLMTRDKLVGYLWPERDGERARRLLSAALYDLRQELGEDAIRSPGDDIGLDPAHVTSDAAAFLAALEEGDVETAIDLYGGPFLDGVHLGAGGEFDHWADEQRQRYAWKYREALEGLAARREREGDTRGAADAWRRLANADPFNTRVALGYMRALDAAGDRARALQFYDVHTALLREELEAEPDPDVVALADRLREEPAGLDTGEAPRERAAGDPAVAAEPAAGGPQGGEPAPAVGPSPEPGDRDGDVGEEPRAIPPAVDPDPARPEVRPGGPLRAARWWAAAAIVVALTGAAVALTLSRDGAPDRLGVAVLPFENLSSATDDQYLADGLTDEILTALARLDQLRVPGRVSAFAVTDRPLSAREVARRLQVEYLVVGAVKRGADRIRVSARLVDAASGEVVWNESYERRLGQVYFEVQERIARSIVAALRPRLEGSPGELADRSTPLVHTTTSDEVAYDLYLKARERWHSRTPRGLVEALGHLNRAIERDRTYARAYAAVADVYNVLGAYDYGVRRPTAVYPMAEQAARRALALDPGLPEAHAALGVTLFNFHWDHDGAEEELLRAISLNPGDVMAHHWYSLVLRTAGRHEAAMAEIRIARELDPLSPVISTSLARHYYFDGDYERARAEARNALALDSTYFQAHLAAGLIAVQRGEYEAAMESYRTAERVLGMEAPVIAALTAHALGAAGRPGQARRLYEGLRSLPDSVYVPPQFLAIAAIGAGRHDEAVDWLEAALEERSAAFLYMEIEPAVEPLRDHPGFRRLLARAEALDPPPAHSTSRPAAGR